MPVDPPLPLRRTLEMNNLIMRIQSVFQKHGRLVLTIAGAVLFAETYFLLIRPGFIIPTDWTEAFRPAALAMLEGRSPYETLKVFNPPWVFLPMIPLALLPVDLSSTAMFLLAFIGVAVAAYRLGAKTGNILIFLANPYTFFGASMGNIDWLIPLGAVLPPQIGLFLVLSKPQIGLGVAIFWLIEAYQSGGIKQVIRIFWPVTLATVISVVMYGFYLLQGLQLVDAWCNFSLWPYAIPIGLALIIYAVQNKNLLSAVASGAFLSPYLTPQSLAIPIFGTIKNRAVLIGVVIGSWVTYLLLTK